MRLIDADSIKYHRTTETDEPDCLTKFCPNCGAKMEGGHNP